jgi:hypothetical protein
VIILPSTPGPVETRFRLVSAANDLNAAFGGPTQRLGRRGSRWSCDVKMPPMVGEDARLWLSRLVRGEANVVAMAIVETGLPAQGPAGNDIRVDGAGQLGSTLAIKGVTPSYQIVEGKWLSVAFNGRAYLYMVTEDVTADAAGEAAVKIAPMLRASPPDNAVVSLNSPVIAGFVTPAGIGWSIDTANHYGLEFTIQEVA